MYPLNGFDLPTSVTWSISNAYIITWNICNAFETECHRIPDVDILQHVTAFLRYLFSQLLFPVPVRK